LGRGGSRVEGASGCDVKGKCDQELLLLLLQVPKWPKLKEVSEDYMEHTAHAHVYDQVCVCVCGGGGWVGG